MIFHMQGMIFDTKAVVCSKHIQKGTTEVFGGEKNLSFHNYRKYTKEANEQTTWYEFSSLIKNRNYLIQKNILKQIIYFWTPLNPD